MDEDGTTAVIMSGTNGQGRILERQSGTSWTSVMDVQGKVFVLFTWFVIDKLRWDDDLNG